MLSKDGKLQSGPRPRRAAGPLRGFAVTRPSDQEARRKNKMKKTHTAASPLSAARAAGANLITMPIDVGVGAGAGAGVSFADVMSRYGWMLNVECPCPHVPMMTHVHVVNIVTAHALGSELQHPTPTVGTLPLWPPCPPAVLVLVLRLVSVFVFVLVFARGRSQPCQPCGCDKDRGTPSCQPACVGIGIDVGRRGQTEQSSQKAKTCDSPAPACRVGDEKQRACCDDVGRVHELGDRGYINARVVSWRRSGDGDGDGERRRPGTRGPPEQGGE